jgi:aminoglycoside 3-N-acetyltransferase
MQKPLTKDDIVEGLRGLGLERGAAVEVHSSLSSMGFVEGGAPTVIQALMEVVGEEGAIVMSAYRVTPPLPLTEEEKARGIIAKVRFLNENDNSKTGMGLISDTFRTWPDTCLGKGIHRVCAWGKNIELHSLGYEYLLSIDGWVLLIGVDINRCSSMHIAEGKVEWPKELTEALRLPDEIQQEYPESEWFVQYKDPLKPPPEDAWGKVIAEAEHRGLVRRGWIGEAECLFFKARAVVGIYEEMLRSDPFKLFGMERKSDLTSLKHL